MSRDLRAYLAHAYGIQRTRTVDPRTEALEPLTEDLDSQDFKSLLGSLWSHDSAVFNRIKDWRRTQGLET